MDFGRGKDCGSLTGVLCNNTIESKSDIKLHFSITFYRESLECLKRWDHVAVLGGDEANEYSTFLRESVSLKDKVVCKIT